MALSLTTDIGIDREALYLFYTGGDVADEILCRLVMSRFNFKHDGPRTRYEQREECCFHLAKRAVLRPVRRPATIPAGRLRSCALRLRLWQ